VQHLPLLLTVDQTARELQITQVHVRRLVQRGQLRANKLTPSQRGAVRIPRTSLAAYLRETAA
jgi:excisionase family DNA binding protein